MTQQNYQQTKYDEENAHDINKEKQKEELHKQMGNIIKHADPHNDSADLVTDIDARFDLKEPLADGQTDEDKTQHPQNPESSQKTERPQHRLTLTMAEIKHIYNDEVEKAVEEKPEQVGFFGKICTIINFPVEIVSMAIIPNVDDEKVGAWYMPILPFTSVLAFITITKRRPSSSRMDHRIP